mmetsp:Transcript_33826/g.116370  ORF Transcript_33826/g.116370 Transcript_33826/m.116370 type:complete len:237 (+) Transcript_33826:431-1141(+)
MDPARVLVHRVHEVDDGFSTQLQRPRALVARRRVERDAGQARQPLERLLVVAIERPRSLVYDLQDARNGAVDGREDGHRDDVLRPEARGLVRSRVEARVRVRVVDVAHLLIQRHGAGNAHAERAADSRRLGALGDVEVEHLRRLGPTAHAPPQTAPRNAAMRYPFAVYPARTVKIVARSAASSLHPASTMRPHASRGSRVRISVAALTRRSRRATRSCIASDACARKPPGIEATWP